MVLAALELARGLRFQRPHRQLCTGEISALTGKPEPCAGQPQIEEPPAVAGHRRGKPLGGGDARGGFVEQAVQKTTRGEDHGQFCVPLGRVRREGCKQRAERGVAAAEDQIYIVVGQQPGGMSPVAGGLRLPDPLHHVAVLLVPLRSRPVQRVDDRRGGAPQLELEKVRQQVMEAKLRPSGIERGDERVLLLERLQDRLRARAAGQRVGERTADPLQHGGAEKQVADLRRLALENFREQITGDRALAAGELGHEAFGVGMLGERDRRQPQPGRPSLRCARAAIASPFRRARLRLPP